MPADAELALVTGGSGFIGSAVCRALRAAGSRVRVLGRTERAGPWDEFVQADITDPTLAPEVMAGVSVVYHAAGKAHAMREAGGAGEQHAVNADGVRRIYDAAGQAGVQAFVLFSSVKAMGSGGDQRVDEDFTAPPDTPYGRAKRAAEEHVLQGGLHTVVLRPALVYGRGWKGNLDKMFRAVKARRFPPVPEVGNRRSLVHVDDVATAALLVASRPEAHGRVFILTDGETYSTRRIFEAMCTAARCPVPRWHVPVSLFRGAAAAGDMAKRLGIPRVPFESEAMDRILGSAWYDSTRIRRELAWTSRYTLESSLPEIAADAATYGMPRSALSHSR